MLKITTTRQDPESILLITHNDLSEINNKQ